MRFVELSALGDGVALAGTVAAALGLPQAGGAQPVAALVRHLAPLVAALVQGAPGVRLLLTSQVPPKVAAEYACRLGALAVPADSARLAAAQACAAMALFTLGALAQDRHFALTEAKLAPVIALCRRLDASPLTIELAAARLRGLGLPALLRGMDQRLRLLTDGRRDAPRRHQSLHAALAWSHGLPVPAEQAVLRRLTVFAGRLSLPALRAALADGAPGGLDEWTVPDAPCTLVDHALIALLPAQAGPDDAARYCYLDTPRAFAREQLQAGDERPLQRRHAQAMRGFCSAARDSLHQRDQHFGRWLAALPVGAEDGLAAVAWAIVHDPACALEIAPVVSRTILGRRGAHCKAMWLAVEPLLDGALAAAPAHGSPPGLPVPARVLGRPAWECGKSWANTRLAHSALRCQQAVAQARLAGDRQTEHMALDELGWGCGSRSDLAGLRAVMAQRDVLRDPAWPRHVEAASCEHEEWLYALQDDPDGEIRCLARVAERSRRAGLGAATCLANMATAMMDAGRFEEARAHAQVRVMQAAGERNTGSLRHDLNNLLRACLALDLTAAARAAPRDFWPLALCHDLQVCWADSAALLAALEQRPHAAMALPGHAGAVFANAGTPRQPGEQLLCDRALRLAAQALGEAAAYAARRQGCAANLPEATLSGLAFGTADFGNAFSPR